MNKGRISDEDQAAANDLMTQLFDHLETFACWLWSRPPPGSQEALALAEWNPQLLWARPYQASAGNACFMNSQDTPCNEQPLQWLRQFESASLLSWYERLEPISEGFPEDGVPLFPEDDMTEGTMASCLTGDCSGQAC